ncbi:MAG TPA: DNA-processing protein DprA [Pseudonocardiaceae bacterium]
MPDHRADEHAALVALLRSLPKGARWNTVTEQLLERGSAVDVWTAEEADALLARPERAELLAQAAADVARWRDQGRCLVGILDDDYPARLRDVHQAPPFLFAAGQLVADDPAIAVVGSRRATPRSLEIASTVATELVKEGVTVLSGLADGVDGAAHRAALDAGGRTVAVIGTGIDRTYPAVNRELQHKIAAHGLVLSQFWPDAPPQPHNFIMRNAVMSGYGRATVVVQAGEHSGARAQARMAVEHGRPVILTDQVVADTEWAKHLQGRPGVHVASSLAEVMDQVRSALNQDREVDALLAELAGSML